MFLHFLWRPAEWCPRCCSSARCSVLLWCPSFPANHNNEKVNQKVVGHPQRLTSDRGDISLKNTLGFPKTMHRSNGCPWQLEPILTDWTLSENTQIPKSKPHTGVQKQEVMCLQTEEGTNLRQRRFVDAVDVGFGLRLNLLPQGFVTHGAVDQRLHQHTQRGECKFQQEETCLQMKTRSPCRSCGGTPRRPPSVWDKWWV